MSNKDNVKIVLTALVIILGVTLVGVFIGWNNTLVELDKYKTILEVSCDYAVSPSNCEKGMDMLKNMDAKDIRKWGLYK